MTGLRNYTRWRTEDDGRLTADLLNAPMHIGAVPARGLVEVQTSVPHTTLSPDEARLIGVRLVEAAALADGDRAVRRSSTGDPTP